MGKDSEHHRLDGFLKSSLFIFFGKDFLGDHLKEINSACLLSSLEIFELFCILLKCQLKNINEIGYSQSRKCSIYV